jgi:hypothetical protein
MAKSSKKKPTNLAIEREKRLTLSSLELVRRVGNELMTRSELWGNLGKSFGGHRDLYVALGYPKTLQYPDFWERYDRDGIAKRIIEAPVTGSWKKKPVIMEDKDKTTNTKFEEDIKWLEDKIKMFYYLVRADIISGIGSYGVLLFGVNDGKELDQPLVASGSNHQKLLYLRPYTEENAVIDTYEKDPKNERYGKPLFYKITTNLGAEGDGSRTLRVHYSRVLHLADGCVENDVYGTPRLKPVFNRLIDYERIIGCSAEMFWRGAIPGYNFKADPDVDMSSIDTASWENEIEKFVHDLKRYVKLQGISVESITSEMHDPTGPSKVVLQAISGSTRIPLRILVGSERGELASVQDDKNWAGRLDERRQDYVEPFIVRPFIDRLIELQIISEPAEEYEVDWPELAAPSDNELAEVNRKKTESAGKYAGTPGMDYIWPVSMFQRDILGFTEEEILEAEQYAEELAEQEAIEEEEAMAAMAEEEERLRQEQELGDEVDDEEKKKEKKKGVAKK